MSLLVDQYGQEIERDMAPADDAPCPRCGDDDGRHVVTAFGGWWRLMCSCGHEFGRGRGDVPPMVSA